MDSKLKKKKIRQKKRQLIKEQLQASGQESSESIKVQLDIPVYDSLEQVPDENEGSIIFVNGEGLLMEDGN